MLLKGNSDPAIKSFWNTFTRYNIRLGTLTTADDPIYDIVLNKLQKINPGLFFEFSFGPDDHQLIITAEGNRDLFDLVNLIIASAPRIAGWKLIALKPRNGFPLKVTWQDFSVEIERVHFLPLEKQETRELGLELLVPGVKNEDIDNCHAALLRAIDYGLGEKRFAESVAGTFVTPVNTEARFVQGIPLVKLDEFINWHEQRLTSSQTDRFSGDPGY